MATAWARTRCAATAVVATLLALGCAAADSRRGVAGPVSWEIVDETLVLRETGGIGITFTKVKTTVPIPPTMGGREYYGGIGERAFSGRLGPRSELRIQLRGPHRPGYAEYELVGFDDTGRSVSVPVRVRW